MDYLHAVRNSRISITRFFVIPLLALLIFSRCELFQKNVLNSSNKKLASTITKNPAEHSNCTYARAVPIRKNQKPIWVPSFPGSGAELFRELMTTVTSQATIDGALIGECQPGKFVTCKTHWPTLNYTKRFQDPLPNSKQFSSDVIMLLRNPINSIPSWYNQIYEERVKAEFHSTQAPESSWNRWIQLRSTLRERMALWKEMIVYWARIDQDPQAHYTVSHWIPYEKLVSNSTGPRILSDVGTTLKKQGAPVSEDITCLWRYIVEERRGMKRGEHKYVPLYLSEHKTIFLEELDSTIQAIKELGAKSSKKVSVNAKYANLMRTLQSYRNDIDQSFHLRVVNNNVTKRSATTKKGKA